MKTCLLKFLSLWILTLFLFTESSAALIELEWDDGIQGNTDLTLDTNTGLVWLDLTVTEGMSYNNVFRNTGIGGNFEGFRYATSDEVRSLYDFASPLEIILSPSPSEQTIMEELQSKTGITIGSIGLSTFQLGIIDLTQPGFPENQIIARTALDFTSSVAELHLEPVHGSVDKSAENAGIGSYLLRTTSPVPIPTALYLFGSGLIVLVGAARKRVQLNTE